MAQNFTLSLRIRGFCTRHVLALVAVALAGVYFLVQLSFINEYGVTWDEPLHRNWGKIFYLFWKSGDRLLLDVMPGHGIHYGPVYYLVNFLLSEKLFQGYFFEYVAANHVLTILTASCSVAFVFLLASNFGKRIGFLAVLFFVFFPPFQAHAHYNPKDIPLMAGILFTGFLFLRALRSGKRRDFCVTGLFLGMCLALKVSTLLLLPVFGVSYLLLVFEKSKTVTISLRSELITIVAVACAFVLGAFFAWPSAWGDFSLIPRSVHFFLQTDFWPGKVLFFGIEYTGAGLPWYYTPLEYAMVTPVIMLLFAFAGSFLVIQNIVRGDGKWGRAESAFVLFWFWFPLFISIKPGLVRYDGMRQFFFCLPALALLAAIGLEKFLVFVQKLAPQTFWPVSLSCTVLFSSLAHEVTILHPFEGSYRNELVRLLYPADLDRSFQIEYWGATYKQGMDWLREHAEPNPVICVPTAGILVTWYHWRDDFTFECSAASNYIMFFTRYSEVQQYAFLKDTPVFTIERMHSTLLKIYKVR